MYLVLNVTFKHGFTKGTSSSNFSLLKKDFFRAIRSVFHGQRIPTEVLVPCWRKEKYFRSQIFFILSDTLKKYSLFDMSGGKNSLMTMSAHWRTHRP